MPPRTHAYTPDLQPPALPVASSAEASDNPLLRPDTGSRIMAHLDTYDLQRLARCSRALRGNVLESLHYIQNVRPGHLPGPARMQALNNALNAELQGRLRSAGLANPYLRSNRTISCAALGGIAYLSLLTANACTQLATHLTATASALGCIVPRFMISGPLAIMASWALPQLLAAARASALAAHLAQAPTLPREAAGSLPQRIAAAQRVFTHLSYLLQLLARAPYNQLVLPIFTAEVAKFILSTDLRALRLMPIALQTQLTELLARHLADAQENSLALSTQARTMIQKAMEYLADSQQDPTCLSDAAKMEDKRREAMAVVNSKPDHVVIEMPEI